MRTLSIFTFSMMLLLSLSVKANPLGGGNDFLPVEQAYQVNFTVDQGTLIADWDIAEGYYLYRDKFKLEAYVEQKPQELEAEYQSGIVQYDPYLEKEVEIFYHNTSISAPLQGLPKQFILKIRSQGCADAGLCYAPRSQYFEINQDFGTAVETDKSALSANATTPTAGNSSQTNIVNSAATGSPGTFWLYVMFAIGGGLILNLMPCVFPVLSLKALTFAASSGSPHTHHLHGWAYTAGVVGSFLVAAILILVAKTAGEQTGWGFQLQYPPFVAAIAYLFLFMGLSLSGVVHFGTSLMGIGQGLTTQEGYRGSFFTGILAALVASPCTGPLMAPALGFALTQPPLWALAIFVALGFGMALPFLLLSYSPRLAKMLPRPGPWMERLKELLAFPMYLTAAWLLFVYGRQIGMLGVFYILVGAIGLTFAIWLLKNLPEGPKLRFVSRALAIGSIVFAGYAAVNSEQYRLAEQNDPWLPFSKELVQELRANGQPVLVDFTADWCLTCKANERIALSGETFMTTVQHYNVALVKGDWTNEDPKISEVLAEFNRSGVPLYLVYPSDLSKPPVVLPQLLTQNMVLQALAGVAEASSLAAQP